MTIDNIIPLDSEGQKKYIENTAYNTDSLVLEDEFEGGSLRLTQELKQQAKYAIESRIKANRESTDIRNAQINQNYRMVNREIKENDLGVDPVNIPETYIALEKWVDDLFLLFNDIDQKLKIKNDNNDNESYELINLDEDPMENNTAEEAIKYMGSKIDTKLPGPKKITYWFKRENIIKARIKRGLAESGFYKCLEEFLRNGTISGQYMLKAWPKYNNKTVLFAEDGSHGDAGDIKSQKKKYKCLGINWVDTRNLVFRPDNLDDGVIEICRGIKFSDLMSETVDEYGDRLPNPEYDYEELMKIRSALLERGGSGSNGLVNEHTTASTTASEEIQKIDGDITIAQGHFISMSLPSGKGKKIKSQKCLITVAFLDGDENQDCYPIQVRPYQFERIAFFSDVFSQRDGNISGYGLPEIIWNIQRDINTLVTLAFELIKKASFGVKVGDSNIFEDSSLLSQLEPNKILRVKLQDGQRVSDALQDYPVNVSSLPITLNFIGDLRQTLAKVSRKGFEGEKISPDPTATEANQIFRELEKSVDRVALRLSRLFTDLCRFIYEYSLLNDDEDTTIQVEGFRNDGVNKDNTIKKTPVTKKLNVSKRQMFIEDAQFEIDILNSNQKTAVERQQIMQFINLCAGTFGMVDPNTGQPKQYVDDMGNTVELDMYTLINMAAQNFSIPIDELWKKIQPPTPPGLIEMPQSNQTNPETQQYTDITEQGKVPQVPQISSTPTEQSINASVQGAQF